MDAASDIFWPAMIFTLVAVIVAAVVTGKNKAAAHHARSAAEEERAGPDSPASSQSHDKHTHESRQQDIQQQDNAKSLEAKAETVKYEKNLEDVSRSDCPEFSGAWEEESGIRNALRDYAQSPDAEHKPLRYMAGMLRTCQLEKMMSREELEEEQRVQREQLAAIFQLLKDKQETFGDVTESELQDQLKLYSI